MSYLEQLLEGVEVDWKPLGDFAAYEQPTNYIVKSTDYSNDFETPVLTAGQSFILGYTNESEGINTASVSPVIIFDDFTTANKWVDFDFKVKSSAMKIISAKDESQALLKHIFYWLQTLPSDLVASEHKRQWISNYSKKLIPIPPLSVQKEIVRILDTFTGLTAALKTELIARKKQFAHYRDQLLSFEGQDVEWKPLGELAENLDSKRKPITGSKREPGSIPYYGASGIVDYVKDYIFDGDYLLISEDGANLTARKTPIAFSISGKTWVNNHAHVLSFDSYFERRFVELFLNNIDLTPYISGAAQPKLNKRNLNSIKVPNPPLEVKEHLVSILDKFDTLTNSKTEGLPAEIEMRQKQYEYYRDLLLTFPKPNA